MTSSDMNAEMFELIQKLLDEINERSKKCMSYLMVGRKTGGDMAFTPPEAAVYRVICFAVNRRLKTFATEGDEIKKFLAEQDVDKKTKLFADIQRRIKSIIEEANPYPEMRKHLLDRSPELEVDIAKSESEYLEPSNYKMLVAFKFDVAYLARQAAEKEKAEVSDAKRGIKTGPLLVFGGLALAKYCMNKVSAAEKAGHVTADYDPRVMLGTFALMSAVAGADMLYHGAVRLYNRL